jgi:hypothetical protein
MEISGEVVEVQDNGSLWVCCGEGTRIRCGVGDFLPTDGKWTRKGVDELKSLVLNKSITGSLFTRAESGTDVVAVLYVDPKRTQSLGQLLYKAGLGQLCIVSQLVEEGETCIGYTSYVTSSEDFWIQREDSVILTFQDKMDSAYSNTSSSLSPLPFKAVYPGVACVVKHSDSGCFCRAMIMSSSAAKVEVLFVDYGDTQLCQPTDLYPVLSQFAGQPAEAIHCMTIGAALTSDSEKFCQFVNDQRLSVAFKRKVGKGAKGAGDVMWEVSLKNEDTQKCWNNEVPEEPSKCAESTGISKYSKISLKEGTTQMVYVTHVVNPQSLWVQLATATADLDSVTEGISQVVSTLPKGVSISVGSQCCAVSSIDGVWYRGEVVSVDAVFSQATVLFVDYGNQEVVPCDQITSLPADLSTIPAQAIKVALHGVKPCDLYRGWYQETTTVLQELTTDKELLCKVVAMDTTGGHPLVELVDTQQSNVNVAAELAKRKLTFQSQSDSDSSPKPTRIPPLQPPLKSSTDVVMAAMNSPLEFWVQLAENYTNLTNFMSSMSEYYGNRSQINVLPKDSLKVGTACAARFSVDNAWYRAEVTDTSPQIQVRFVDYGNSEVKSPAEIYQLPPQFTSLPAQAIPCRLTNFKPPSSPTDATSQLEAYLDVQLVGSFQEVDRKGVYSIKLVDTSSGMDKNIGVMLSPAGSVDVAAVSMPTTGAPFPCYVPYVESPTKFYIQFAKWESELNLLLEQMYSHYSATQPATLNPQLKVVYAACFHDDGNWYRSEVLSVSDKNCQVFFVDYGNVVVVALKDLRVLDVKFTSLPHQALVCALDLKNSQELPNAKETMEQLTVDKQVLVTPTGEMRGSTHMVNISIGSTDLRKEVTVPSPRQPSQQSSMKGASNRERKQIPFPSLRPDSVHKLYVVEWKSESSVACQFCDSVAELEVLSHHLNNHYSSSTVSTPPSSISVGDFVCAKFSADENWYRALVTRCCHDDQFEVVYVDYGNEELVSLHQMREMVDAHCQTLVQGVVCSFSSPVKTQLIEEEEIVVRILKQIDQRHYSVELASKKGVSSPGAGTRVDLIDIPIALSSVRESGYIDIQVTVSSSPLLFYCQDQSCTSHLEKLASQLSRHCARLPSHGNPTIGEMCVAKFSQDGAWYRALVERVDTPGGTAKVLFVDYGNTDTVPLSDLRKLALEFSYLPQQAIPCMLSGVTEPDGGWSQEVLNLFENLIVEKSFVAEIKGKKKKDSGQSLLVVELLDGDVVIKEQFLNEVKSLSEGEGQPQRKKHPSLSLMPFTLLKLEQGKSHCGEITHADTPFSFYVQPYSVENQLQMVNKGIEKAVMGTREHSGNIPSLDPSKGAPCLAKYSVDEQWYRGLVEERLNEPRQQWRVKFVDFGNSETISSASNLLRCPPNLLSISALALHCSLHGVNPSLGSRGWSRQAVDSFNDVLLNKEVEFLVVKQDALISQVKLSLNGGDVGESFVRSGFAVVLDSAISEIVSDSNADNTAPSEDLYLSTTSSQVDTVSSTQPSSHQSSDAGDVAMGTKNMTTTFSYPTPPPVGTKLSIVVSFAESPTSFYCQDLKEANNFTSLSQKLSTYCSSAQPGIHGALLPRQPCAAKYSLDGEWYRAEVVEAKGEDKVLVQFVDYGNTELMDHSSLFPLEPELVCLPTQAFWCSVTSDLEHQYSQSETDKFVTMVTDNEFEMTVREADEASLVVSLQDQKGMNVAQMFSTVVTSSNQAPVDTPSDPLHYSYADPPPTGESMTVTVTHINSPLDFYCQNVSVFEAVCTVMKELDVFCKSVKASSLTQYHVGQAVGALYSVDGSWYRGEIVDVQTTESLVTLQYVDYGNTESVKMSDVRPLKSGLLALPPQALWCSLSDNFEEEYTTAEVELFKQLCNEKEFQMVVKKSEGDSIVVSLKDKLGKEVLGKAVHSLPPSTAAAAEFTYPVPPPKGKKMAVIVTHVASPCDFYCVPESEMSALEKLSQDLSLYPKLSTSGQVKAPPQVGTPCAAMFSEDGEWYRGEVSSVDTSGRISVQFVDYGNVGLVEHGNIFPLSAQHVAIPTKAYWCAITDNVEQSFSQSEIDQFKNLILDQTFEMEVCSSTADSLVVRLLDASGKEVTQEPLKSKACLLKGKSEGKCLSFLSAPSSRPGTSQPVFVTYAVSPVDFYCQLTANMSELDSLMAELSDYCNSAPESNGPWEAGVPCAAVSSIDASWYRAEILEVQGTRAKVSFVDYGNTEEVDLATLKPLLPQHVCLPMQALWCSVSADFEFEYSQSDCTTFVQSVTEQEFTMKVLSSEGDSLIVKLLDESGSSLFLNFASSLPPNTAEGTGEMLVSKSQEVVTSPPNSQLEEKEVANRSSTSSYPPQETLSVGSRIQVEVTFAESPVSFYCQDLANVDSLKQLQADLATHCSTTYDTLAAVHPGQTCAALSVFDNCWYRCEVARLVEGGSAEVFYVDFGNSENVPTSNLKPLSPDLLTHPPMARWCSLTSHFEQEFGEDEIEQFVTTVTDQVFELTIRKADDRTLIVSVRDEEGCQVGSVFSDAREKMAADKEGDGESAYDLPDLVSTERGYAIRSADYARLITPTVFKWPLKAGIGDKIEVYVSVIESPSSFFCQPLYMAAELEEMMNLVADMLEGVDPIAQDRATEGVLCGARFTQDDEWYRGVIEGVLPDTNEVNVRYIDYGNKEVLPVSRLVELPPDLLSYQSQVIHCSCVPSEESLSSSEGGDELTKAFDEAVIVGGRYQAMIQKEIARGKYLVVLLDESGVEVRLPSGQQEKGLKQEEPTSSSVQETGEQDEEDENEDKCLADREVEELTQQLVLEEERRRKNIQETVNSHLLQPPPADTVDPYQSLPSPPVKEVREAKEETSGDSDDEDDDTSTESDTNSTSVIPFKLNFGVKELLTVKVSAVESPSAIFLQRSDCASELETLMCDIQQYTLTTKGTESQEGAFYTSTSPPKKGEFVLAKLTEEDTWHRGEISREYDSQTNTCGVCFVDYGVTQDTYLRSIQFCPKMLLMLPQQAIICCLADVPRREAWPEEYTTLILPFVSQKEYLQAEVVLPSVEGMRPFVRLRDPATAVDLSKVILEQLDKECDRGEFTSEEEEKLTEETIQEKLEQDSEKTINMADDVTLVVSYEQEVKEPSGDREVSGKASEEVDLSQEEKDPEMSLLQEEMIGDQSGELPSEVVMETTCDIDSIPKNVGESGKTAPEEGMSHTDAPYDGEMKKSEEEEESKEKIVGEDGKLETERESKQEKMEGVEDMDCESEEKDEPDRENEGSQDLMKEDEVKQQEEDGKQEVSELVETEPVEGGKGEGDNEEKKDGEDCGQDEKGLGEDDDEEWFDVDDGDGECGDREDEDEEGDPIGYDPSEYSTTLPNRTKFGANMTLKIRMANVQNPSSIYCHPVKQRIKLDKLMESLNSFYSDLRPFDFNLTEELSEGEIVCVPTWNDEEEEYDSWYRARVNEVDYSDEDYPMVKVECVDYGTEEDVALEDVRRLANEFARDPPFGMECALSGVKSPSGDGVYSEQCVDYLTTFAELDELMSLKIVQVLQDNKYEVVMVTDDDRSINQALVDGGFCLSLEGSSVTVPISPPKGPSSRETVMVDTPSEIIDLATPSSAAVNTITPSSVVDLTDTPTDVPKDTSVVDLTDTPTDEPTLRSKVSLLELGDTPGFPPTGDIIEPRELKTVMDEEDPLSTSLDEEKSSEVALNTDDSGSSDPVLTSVDGDSVIKEDVSPSKQTSESGDLTSPKSVEFTNSSSDQVVEETVVITINRSPSSKAKPANLQSLEVPGEPLGDVLTHEGGSWYSSPASTAMSYSENDTVSSSPFWSDHSRQPREGFIHGGVMISTGISKSLQSSPITTPLAQMQPMAYSVGSSPRRTRGLGGNGGGITSPPYMSVGVSSFDPSAQNFSQSNSPRFFPTQPPPGPPQGQPALQGSCPPMVFSLGHRIDLILLSCVNPESFVCQPQGSQKLLKLLMDEIGQHLSHHGLVEPLRVEELTVGCCILAKCGQDGRWYRAEVSAVDDPNLIEVFLFDYGNIEQVSLADIQPLPPRFSALSRQGIACSLAHVGPVETPEGWSSQAVERFSSLITSQPFISATVVETHDVNSVSIQIEMSNGGDLADTLVAEGLASPRLSKL